MSEDLVNETGSEEVSSVQEHTDTSAEFNFKELISEDLRTDPSLNDIKDINSLAKGYIHAQKLVGERDANSIRIPGEDAGEEAIKAFYDKLESIPGVVRLPDFDDEEAKQQLFNKLGRPESPDNYDIDVPEDLLNASTELQQFREVAHEAGLTKDQASKVLNFYTKDVIENQLSQFNEAKELGEQALKQKWGADYNARLNGAKLMAQKYADQNPALAQELFNGQLGNNPLVIEMLSDLAAGMSESDIVQGQSKVTYGITAEEALDRISEIRENKSHAFHNPTDPGHRAAVEKVQKLYGVAYPDE